MSWRQTFLVLALDLGYIAACVHHAWALACDELLSSWEARAAYIETQLLDRSYRFSLCESSADKTWYTALNNQRFSLTYQIFPSAGYFWFRTKQTDVIACQIDKNRSSVANCGLTEFALQSRY